MEACYGSETYEKNLKPINIKMKKILLTVASLALVCACSKQKANDEFVVEKPQVKVEDGRFTPEVMWSLGVMSEYAVSPDGKQVLYTVRYTDMEQNKNNAELYVMPVEGGSFTMGCTHPRGEKHTYADELPLHKVTVNSFYIGRFEVTQGLWKKVMGENPSKWFGNDSLPVEQVSWNDVQIFIARLSQITGYRFRLPTEAEWEYAARGGVRSNRTPYPGTRTQVWEACWFGGNSNGHSHPVGRLKPNELGLYDMGGNVMEWCSDWMESYTDKPQNCPQGPRNGENRILRGGCFNSPTWGCSVFERSWYLPDYGYSFYGFRLVLDSPERDEEE